MAEAPFVPPARLLLGPGPSDVDPRVLAAQAQSLIGHLDPEFIKLMDRIKTMLREVFGTANPFTLPISGTGSAGMEASFVNFLRPGDRVVVGVNGVFGTRMTEVAWKLGGQVERVVKPWGQVFTPADFGPALAKGPAKLLAIVHAETSTGAWQPIEGMAAVAHDHGALLLVDTVTSLGGVPVEVDRWEADIVYSGTQKCLSVPPGLSPLTLSPKALEALKVRAASGPVFPGTTPPPSNPNSIQSWYLDLMQLEKYWGSDRVYHHTAPISALYGLHEGLRLVLEEGLAARLSRHAKNSAALWAGLAALGLKPWAQEGHRLPSLNAVTVPDGVDEVAVRKALLTDYSIEIGGGLGELKGKIWRVGLMGHSSRIGNVMRFLEAFAKALGTQMKLPDVKPALSAAEAAAR
ncbi:MAG: alanine--glyoxylate aminotransferase family protein [Candidatus Coatesbacteria bacterium]|mgnify:CR=1 FL=1